MGLPPLKITDQEGSNVPIFNVTLPNDMRVSKSGITGTLTGPDTKNYLKGNNSDFATGIGAWTTFDDGSVAVPVDGTGGTPANISIARTTTGGQGLGSYGAALAITKANTADSQGEGAVCAFTIPESQQGKQQSFSFSVKSGSGFVNSLFRCFIYDVTNSEVINVLTQESGELFATPSTGSGFTGTWIASSNSTSYRAIIMCTGTATDDFEFYITDIVLGPIGTMPAYNSTDWESFTPTGSWTTNTTYTGFKRRVGDSLEVKIKVLCSGAPNSTNLSINMPSGLTIDSNKVLSSGNFQGLVGVASIIDSTATAYPGAVGYATSSTLEVFHAIPASNAGRVNQATPFTFGASDEVNLQFIVPIEDWISSDVMSTHRADLRTLKVLTASSAGTHNSSGNYDDMTFTEDVDTHSSFDGTTFTAPFSGEYAVDFNMFWSSNATGIRLSTLLKNGTNIAYGVITTGSVAGNSSPLSQTVKLAKGDTLKVQSYQDSGGNLNWSVASLQIVGTPDFSVFGVKGINSYKASTSSVKTPTASSTWQQHTGNSVTLEPGTYNVFIQARFDAAGGLPYHTNSRLQLGGANGADSGAAPALASTLSGVTVEFGEETQTPFDNGTTTFTESTYTMSNLLRVKLTETQTLYCNTVWVGTTAAFARVTARIYADRVI